MGFHTSQHTVHIKKDNCGDGEKTVMYKDLYQVPFAIYNKINVTCNGDLSIDWRKFLKPSKKYATSYVYVMYKLQSCTSFNSFKEPVQAGCTSCNLYNIGFLQQLGELLTENRIINNKIKNTNKAKNQKQPLVGQM